MTSRPRLEPAESLVRNSPLARTYSVPTMRPAGSPARPAAWMLAQPASSTVCGGHFGNRGDATLVGFSAGGGEVARYIDRLGTARAAQAVLKSASHR